MHESGYNDPDIIREPVGFQTAFARLGLTEEAHGDAVRLVRRPKQTIELKVSGAIPPPSFCMAVGGKVGEAPAPMMREKSETFCSVVYDRLFDLARNSQTTIEEEEVDYVEVSDHSHEDDCDQPAPLCREPTERYCSVDYDHMTRSSPIVLEVPPLYREPTDNFCSVDYNEFPRAQNSAQPTKADLNDTTAPENTPPLCREPTDKYCSVDYDGIPRDQVYAEHGMEELSGTVAPSHTPPDSPRVTPQDSPRQVQHEPSNPDNAPAPLVREPSKNNSAVLQKKLKKRRRGFMIATEDLEIGAALLPRFSFSAMAVSKILGESLLPPEKASEEDALFEAPATPPAGREKIGKVSFSAAQGASVSTAPTCMLEIDEISGRSTPRRHSREDSSSPGLASPIATKAVEMGQPDTVVIFDSVSPPPKSNYATTTKKEKSRAKNQIELKVVKTKQTQIAEQSFQRIAGLGNHGLDTF